MQEGKPLRFGRARFAVLLAAALVGATLLGGAAPVLAQSTLERIRETKQVRVAIADEAPYGYRAASGRVTGEAPEITRVILERIDPEIEIEWISTDFGQLIPGLQVGEFDIAAAGMFITPARCAAVAFSDPTYVVGEAFAVQEGNPKGLTDYQAISNHPEARVGLIAGTVEYNYALVTGIPADRAPLYRTFERALEALKAGEIDAVGLTSLTAQNLVDGEPDLEATPQFYPTLDGEEVKGYGGFAFREQDQELHAAFNGSSPSSSARTRTGAWSSRLASAPTSRPTGPRPSSVEARRMTRGRRHAEPAGTILGHPASPAPRTGWGARPDRPPRVGHRRQQRAGPAPHGAGRRRDLHQPDRANANPMTIDNLRAMAGDVTRAARGILSGNRVDVLVYGCTSGTVAIGEAEIARLIGAARPGLPCTNPISAALAACATFGARRISLLTPYTAAVNDAIADDLRSRGLEVVSVAGFDLERDDDMTAVPPAAILAAGVEVCDPRGDLLFVSCTALRTSQVVAELEAALGKPVVASNPALLWHALRLIGNADPIHGFGRLFDQPLAA